jgi:hypothetical protein
LIFIKIGVNSLYTRENILNTYLQLNNPHKHMGEKIFVMHHIWRCKLAFGIDMDVIKAYNIMYLAHRYLKVEWGIGGSKHNW